MSKIICYAKKQRSPHVKFLFTIFNCWRERFLKYWNSVLKIKLKVNWNIFISSYVFKLWLTVQYQRRHQEKLAFITVVIYSYYLNASPKGRAYQGNTRFLQHKPCCLSFSVICHSNIQKNPFSSSCTIFWDLSLSSHTLWSQISCLAVVMHLVSPLEKCHKLFLFRADNTPHGSDIFKGCKGRRARFKDIWPCFQFSLSFSLSPWEHHTFFIQLWAQKNSYNFLSWGAFFSMLPHLLSPKNTLPVNRWHKYNWWCDVERQFQCKWAIWEQGFKCSSFLVSLINDRLLWPAISVNTEECCGSVVSTFQAFCSAVKWPLTNTLTHPFDQFVASLIWLLYVYVCRIFCCIIPVETWKNHGNESPHSTFFSLLFFFGG